MSLLSIKNLHVTFQLENQDVADSLAAVRNVSLQLEQGECLAIVGESGSGKSQLFNAVMGLLADNGSASGEITFLQQSILNQSNKVLNKIRGVQIGMVFQDPMTALNPYLKIGKQLNEVLQTHLELNEKSATERSLEMLQRVSLKHPRRVFNSYPHQLSGGMRQRVVIAMALVCEPKLIIADEPTTALDVTVQTEIIRLLKAIHAEFNTSMVLITHDLPLVAGLCDRIAVMYAGKVVEMGTVEQIFHHPYHPYTHSLLAATPQNAVQGERLMAIPGQPPNPLELPEGCAFVPRCRYVTQTCEQQPELQTVNDGQVFACHHALQTAAR